MFSAVRLVTGFFITILHNGSIVMKLIFRISHVSYVQLLCLTLSILYVDPFRINQTCVVAQHVNR